MFDECYVSTPHKKELKAKLCLYHFCTSNLCVTHTGMALKDTTSNAKCANPPQSPDAPLTWFEGKVYVGAKCGFSRWIPRRFLRALAGFQRRSSQVSPAPSSVLQLLTLLRGSSFLYSLVQWRHGRIKTARRPISREAPKNAPVKQDTTLQTNSHDFFDGFSCHLSTEVISILLVNFIISEVFHGVCLGNIDDQM